MQAQQKLFNKIVFTLNLKVSTFAIFKCDVHSCTSRPLLPCFSYMSSLFSFQGANPAGPGMVENSGIEPLTS